MIWIYDSEGKRLLYEIRHEAKGHGYEIVLKFPDGRECVERVADASELMRRSNEIQRELERQGWEPLTPV